MKRSMRTVGTVPSKTLFITFPLNPDRTINSARLAPVSPLADLSFDYQDLLLNPAENRPLPAGSQPTLENIGPFSRFAVCPYLTGAVVPFRIRAQIRPVSDRPLRRTSVYRQAGDRVVPERRSARPSAFQFFALRCMFE